MLKIKRCITDHKRLILQMGKKFWHISYQEGRNLLEDLKRLKVDRRK